MIGVVFSYEAPDAAEFERIYGPGGDWTQFFENAEGYIGTELLRDLEIPGRYLVVDRWESADAYNAFIEANREQYMERVDDTAYAHDQELQLGAFESLS